MSNIACLGGVKILITKRLEPKIVKTKSFEQKTRRWPVFSDLYLKLSRLERVKFIFELSAL
jgi:hypothetical protein